MPKFIPYNPNQSRMVVVNYADQLQPCTFEHAIHYLIEHKLDLSIFHPTYNNEDTGRPAYDPAILLKIILFAYSKGIISSREIQWSCDTNILFKALSCDTVPHFTTIANFVSGYSDEIEALFEQVLLICDEQGLLGKELFAIDGCKMPSNASKEWSGTHKELTQKREKIQRQIHHHITEHKKLDKNESRDEERRQRAEQAIETLTKAHEKIDRFLKSNSPRMVKGRIKKEVKSNITDKESAKIATSKGTIQGYNGIATVDMKHQIIIDAQAFGEGQEHHALQPVLNSVRDRFKRLGIKLDKPIVTADTGYAPAGHAMWLHHEGKDKHGHDKVFFEGRLTKCRACDIKQRCMRNPASADHRKGHGRQVSFILKKGQRVPTYTDWMKRRVDTDKGKLIYSHRMSVVEPVFGNIGTTSNRCLETLARTNVSIDSACGVNARSRGNGNCID